MSFLGNTTLLFEKIYKSYPVYLFGSILNKYINYLTKKKDLHLIIENNLLKIIPKYMIYHNDIVTDMINYLEEQIINI